MLHAYLLTLVSCGTGLPAKTCKWSLYMLVLTLRLASQNSVDHLHQACLLLMV